MIEKKPVKVKSRNESFVPKAQTAIWQENSDDPNGYVVNRNYCFGYSQEDLIESGYSITDMLYLLTRGELPSTEQRALLDALGVALCNLGPRHPATRAAMEVSVSKTRTPHILPISLMVLGGEHAAGGVESSMRFIRRHKKKPVEDLVSSYLQKHAGSEEDAELMPGFGPRFGTREPLYANLANTIRRRFDKTDLPFLDLALAIDKEFQNKRMNHAIKSNGLAAAIFLDLGFHPRFGSALMQWLVAPGLLAHGLEMSNKPLTAMPFVTDDSYHHLGNSEEGDD